MAKNIRQQISDLTDKIAKLTQEKAALEVQAENVVDTAAVQPGRIVTFDYGKGETKRSLTGQVVGRKDVAEGVKGGDMVKVAVGEGFDALLLTIYPNVVTKLHPLTEAEPPAVEAEVDPANLVA
jgi:hypothetical protein